MPDSPFHRPTTLVDTQLPTMIPMPTITRLKRFCALARTSAGVSSSTTMNATKMKQPKQKPCNATPSRTVSSESVYANSAMRAA